MFRTLRCLKRMKYLAILGLTLKTLASVGELSLPWIIDYMIDDVAPTGDMQSVIWLSVLMLVIAVLTALGHLFANRSASKVACNAVEDIRNEVFTKIYSLSIKQLDDITISSAISRLTTDIQHIQQLVAVTIRMGIRAPILILGGLAFALAIDPTLSIILLLALPFIGVTAYITTRKGTMLQRDIQVANDDLVKVTRDIVWGIKEVKGFNTQEKETKRFDEVSSHLRDCEFRSSKLMSILNPLVNLWLNLGLVLVIGFGAYWAQNGTTTSGNIIAFLSYFTMISGALIAINRLFLMIVRGIASGDRIAQIMDMPPEKVKELKETTDNNRPYLVFDNVSFKYGSGNNVLESIDFTAEKGQTLGILGPTGSGKSTLISLLQGFYRPAKGRIFLDNVDIATLNESEIHKKFGVVMQNDSVFSESVKGNVKIGRDLTDEEVYKALETATLKKFIDEKEEGLDYDILGDGTNLSGGQKQRLLISRAIAKEPEILILDDSSSALDYYTDATIRKAIAKDMNCTTIIIAQRITSVMDSDKIVLLSEKGSVVAIGKHADLIEKCPEYISMWKIQTGGLSNE